MHTRGVGFLFPAMLLAAGLGAAFWTWTLAQHIDHVERRGRQTSARIDQLESLLDEVAAQELIYVAGRADREMLERGASVLQQIASDTSSLLAQALASEAPSARLLSERSATIGEIEDRARENVRTDLDLMAADLIFTATHETRRAMQRELRALRAAEFAAVAAERSADLRQAWMALAVVALLYAWALVRWSRVPAVPVPQPTVLPTEAAGSPRRLDPGSVPVSSVDLIEAADLCSAIGRLKSTAELPGLLERAGAVLGAPGIVIWMAAAEELLAAATHGYDPTQVSLLVPVGRATVNATANAWRTGRLQTVAGDSTSRGAVVAPMIGPDRCIGVLAIEVVPGREAEVGTQAVATLVAAQLAAVLVAWPAGSSAAAEILPFERAAGAST